MQALPTAPLGGALLVIRSFLIIGDHRPAPLGSDGEGPALTIAELIAVSAMVFCAWSSFREQRWVTFGER